MNEPKGADILSTLIQLLAEQEQVKIKFELEGKNNERKEG